MFLHDYNVGIHVGIDMCCGFLPVNLLASMTSLGLRCTGLPVAGCEAVKTQSIFLL